MVIERRDVRRSFRVSPVRRAVAELYCLLRTFTTTEDNHDSRKYATVLVVAAWATIEVGAAFRVANLPDQFLFLRLVVGVIVGRMWGIEVNNFAGVEFRYDEEGTDGDD